METVGALILAHIDNFETAKPAARRHDVRARRGAEYLRAYMRGKMAVIERGTLEGK
jgi:hypothetical protein